MGSSAYMPLNSVYLDGTQKKSKGAVGRGSALGMAQVFIRKWLYWLRSQIHRLFGSADFPRLISRGLILRSASMRDKKSEMIPP